MATESQDQLSEVERIKNASRYLRGTLEEGLANPITGGVTESDQQITKFHGLYQQDDRDLRAERRRQRLEPAYQFMVRVRAPGGIVTPQQWLTLDQLSRDYGNGTFRLTTRQSFQFHGVLKRHIRPTIRRLNEVLLDTLAACGDVNRNVMCNPNPYQSRVHEAVYERALELSRRLTPQTRAYHEIWLDGQKQSTAAGDDEPVYGKAYLPRKFKIAIAVPPSNDVDVFAHDVGFIAILGEGDRLEGFNVSVGGGLGMTHSEPATYPQLGRVIGFIPPDRVTEVGEAVVRIQRDHGDRANRKHARLKYTIDDRGLDWLTGELERQLGWKLEEARPYTFEHNGDRFGWVRGTNGKWHYTLFVENGRIKDTDERTLMSGLREIAAHHNGDLRVTPNQNLLLGNVTAAGKERVEIVLRKHGIENEQYTSLRRNAMACVALPTCGLAMAESERYLPSLLDKIETVMADAGLAQDTILIRMTGCPNGCARPYLGEIGFVGKAVGSYNLYLGAAFAGQRLNKLYRENVGEKDILEALTPLIHQYASERLAGERFGDFVIRKGHVKEVTDGRHFHV